MFSSFYTNGMVSGQTGRELFISMIVATLTFFGGRHVLVV